MAHKIVVGQELFQKGKVKNEKVIVEKVGRLYFNVKYADNDFNWLAKINFSLEDLTYRNKMYSQRNERLYLSEQEIIDEQECANLSRELRMKMDRISDLTLDQVKRILAIINEETNKN